MFNLFGSFFFGRGSTVEPTSNNETSSTSPSSESTLIQTTAITPTSNTDAATQTANVDDQLLMVTSQTHTSNGDMDELQKQWVIVERAKQQQQQQQMQNQCVATSTTHLDDVKEEDETPVTQQQQQHTEVEMSEEASLPTRDDEDDGDVLVGSFFDRNQFDDSPKETETTTTATNPAPTRDEWLITPLPCLTSITCSQRSLVENDPLENLLIEHPSMSVFVTVTSSAMATPTTTTTTTTEPIESAVFKVFSENAEEEKKVETSLGKSVVVVVSQRKRKGMESAQSPSSQQHQSPSPTSTMRRKANKRNKKSSPSVSVSLSPVAAVSTETVQSGPVVNSSNNKENMQVRTLLTSEFRSKANPASKLDSILLSKNQLKRNNKHANKFNSNNCLQRKFHKLQQPVCC